MNLTFSTKRPLVAAPNSPEMQALARNTGTFGLQHDGHVFLAPTQDMLRSLQDTGISAQIADSYGWPGKFQPMSHQLETIRHLLSHHRCTVLDDMGTGKTAACIWAMFILNKLNLVRRVWVLAPLTCLNAVWKQEFWNLLPSVHVEVFDATRRRTAPLPDAGVVVTNHDAVKAIYSEREWKLSPFAQRMRDWQPDLIIVDEADAYKSTTSQRSHALHQIIKSSDAWVWALSGTPIGNTASNAVGIHKLIHPDTHWSVSRFRMAHMVKMGMRWVNRASAIDSAHKLLQPSIRHTREQCLQLPELTYTSREVPMTKEQETAYKKMRSAYHAVFDKTEVTAANAAVALGKLLQICAGTVKDNDGNDTPVKNHRMEAVIELIRGAPSKCLVFANYVASIEQVLRALTHANIKSAPIHGGISQAVRNASIREFKHGSTQVLVAHPRTMAHGLNLTEATTTIWLGPTMSLAQYQQANSRHHRKGQTSPCTVVNIYGSPIELDYYQRLEDANLTQAAILELAEKYI